MSACVSKSKVCGKQKKALTLPLSGPGVSWQNASFRITVCDSLLLIKLLLLPAGVIARLDNLENCLWASWFFDREGFTVQNIVLKSKVLHEQIQLSSVL